MQLAMYSTLFVIILIVACARLGAYKTYHMEELCKNANEAELIVPALGMRTLKFGHNLNYIYNPNGTLSLSATKLVDCTVNVKTNKDYSMALVVEDMNIREIKDKSRNVGWTACGDFLKFTTEHIFHYLNLPSNMGKHFPSKTSRHLCGKTHTAGDNIENITLEDASISTKGNVFHTENSKIVVIFHQNRHPSQRVKNSFTLILTSYKRHPYNCIGVRCYIFGCVSLVGKCDNHINCAMPGGGWDEDPAECKLEEEKSTLNYKTVIIILASLSGAALFLYCIYKSKYRLSCAEHPMDNNSAPQSVPMYEPVVTTIITEDTDANRTRPTKDDSKDLPPSYDQLFPDSHEWSPLTGSESATADQVLPSAPSIDEGLPSAPSKDEC